MHLHNLIWRWNPCKKKKKTTVKCSLNVAFNDFKAEWPMKRHWGRTSSDSCSRANKDFQQKKMIQEEEKKKKIAECD